MRYNRLYKDNNFLTPTTYTQTLSEYAANLKYEDIPPEVVERAKKFFARQPKSAGNPFRIGEHFGEVSRKILVRSAA